MKAAAAKPIRMTASGLSMLRCVVASYFIALSLGLIESTDVTALPALVMAQNQANFLANTVVFILAYFVLMGVWLRPAALLLGGLFLASSGFAAISEASAAATSNFWRDLALIAGLLMTFLNGRTTRYQRPVRKSRPARRVRPGDPVQPRNVDRTAYLAPRRIKPLGSYLDTRNDDATLVKPVTRNSAEVVNIFAA